MDECRRSTSTSTVGQQGKRNAALPLLNLQKIRYLKQFLMPDWAKRGRGHRRGSWWTVGQHHSVQPFDSFTL